tara:strand:- start:5757 stop:6308 length:552 start_codon:yes stop_codon:yes gene_type:complete
MIGKKSLTQRAAEAVKGKASSAELTGIKSEVARRITEVEQLLKLTEQKIEDVMGEGDLDAVRAVRESEGDLRDEDRVLHRMQSELHRAIGIAQGEEAMKAAGQHRKNLEKALEQAEKAQAMLQESERMARQVFVARQQAAQIGESLVFDVKTIRSLAAAIYPEGNQRKQMMIDLGMREVNRNA